MNKYIERLGWNKWSNPPISGDGIEPSLIDGAPSTSTNAMSLDIDTVYRTEAIDIPFSDASQLLTFSDGTVPITPSSEVKPGLSKLWISGVQNTTSIGTKGSFVDQDVNGLLEGSKWNVTNITYSFPNSGANYGGNYPANEPAPSNGFQALSKSQQDVAKYAFKLISEYTPLLFNEIAETDTTHAVIRLAGSSKIGLGPVPNTSYGNYPDSLTGTGGDIFFENIKDQSPAKYGYAFDTILHEIGHTMGLKHGQEELNNHGILPANHDSTEWSIMDYHSYVGEQPQYNNKTDPGHKYPIIPYLNKNGSGNQTYMIDDISALQYLYGANFQTNKDPTVYKWNPITGQEFINDVGQDASLTNTIYRAIWDGGGIDTYDLSGYHTDLILDLNPGAWSTLSRTQLADLDLHNPGLHLAPGNIVNANEYKGDPRSLIENAIGGTGDDILTGNDVDNVLQGGIGNDILKGGIGTDTAVFSGVAQQYIIIFNLDNRYTTYGPDGTDQLYSIEQVQFGTSPAVAINSVLDDYAGNTLTTGTLAAGVATTAGINFAGDTDWFRTTLTAGTTYWFDDEGDVLGSDPRTDTYLRLLGSDGRTVLQTDDNSGTGLNAFLSYTPTTTGNYYVSAQAVGNSVGIYHLSERVADDYPSTSATVGTLAPGSDVRAVVSPAGDTDWFHTMLTAGTTYWFSEEGSATSQGTLIDPYLRLLGSDGRTVLQTDDNSGTGLNAFISYTPTTTGTYYVSAQAAGAGTGSYLLTERAADDYPSNPATTAALAVGGSMVSTYDFVADTDWFRTTLTAGTTYRFDAKNTPTGSGTQIHPMLWLYGDDGATLEASDLSAPQSGGYEAALSYTPTVSGTYFVSVGSYGTNVGTYQLSEAVISGSTPSSAADSRMSFIIRNDDASPAATAAPGTAMAALQPADAGATELLAKSGMEAGFLPDYLALSTGSATQPQHAAYDSSPQSAASLVDLNSGYTNPDILTMLDPFKA